MKKNISICIILFVLLVVILFFLWIYWVGKENENEIENAENMKETETEELYVVSGTTEIPYKYIILEDEGRLSVYYSDNVTLFMNTGISVKDLSNSLQEKLKDGLRFGSEQTLYDFLESYSS